MAQDQEINGVEIFRAGTYKLRRGDGSTETITYSDKDVAELAENTNALLAAKKHEPPAKLGHDDDQALAKMAGLPAIGWVKRVIAKGASLYADFGQVPELVAEAIRRGRYKHISSEIYDGTQTRENFGDIVKGLSLRAVALLGADVPVVKGMNPVLLFSGVEASSVEGRIITLEVQNMAQEFAEKKPKDDEPGSAKVHLNRHPLDAHVKMKGSDAKFQIHAQNPDDSYDVHDAAGNVHKSVPHENLTLLSEKYHQEDRMTADALKLAEEKARDAAARASALEAENKALREKQRNDRIDAFAEKHKSVIKQPPILAALKALAQNETDAPVKLSEGVEKPYLDAFLEFAESLLKAKPVLFGEVAPVTQEGDLQKDTAVKLAEDRFRTYAEDHGIKHLDGASISVAAHKYAEEHKVSFGVAFRKVAQLMVGPYMRGTGLYAERTQEVA